MSTLYIVPPGLDSVDTRETLATEHPEIDDQHYLANGALCHCYTDRRRGAQVRVVESPTSGIPAEILGDSGLWLRIRDVAVRAKARRDAATAARRPDGVAAA